MIHSGALDAIVIATPHYQHVSLGMEALDAGLPLMVEKPIAAHKADAELDCQGQGKKGLGFCRHVSATRRTSLPQDQGIDRIR